VRQDAEIYATIASGIVLILILVDGPLNGTALLSIIDLRGRGMIVT
jgi:hypothetical protein